MEPVSVRHSLPHSVPISSDEISDWRRNVIANLDASVAEHVKKEEARMRAVWLDWVQNVPGQENRAPPDNYNPDQISNERNELIEFWKFLLRNKHNKW